MSTALDLAHITITQWILIALFSGFGAAFFNQIFGGLLAKFQRSSDQRHAALIQSSEQDFKKLMERDARENESLQLLIKSHFEQRERLLESAAESYNWLSDQLYQHHGTDFDVYDHNEPPSRFDSVNQVLGGLRSIAQAHPTRSVRESASKLLSGISSHFSSITGYQLYDGKYEGPEVGGTPTAEDFFKWRKQCDELIELMHTPPTLADVRPKDLI